MKEIRIYKGGELVADFKNVQGLIVQKDGKIEILYGETWFYYEKDEGYDWFCML